MRVGPIKFLRYLRRLPLVHWPRACVAQGVGTLATTLILYLDAEEAGMRVAKVADRLWKGLPG